MTPNIRFLDFLCDIEPSATTKANSVSAHSRVRDVISADDEYSPRAKRIVLGGSYKRDTAIRPREKNGSIDRPDVDLYVVVDGPTYLTTPSDEMEALYSTLDRARNALGITRLTRNRVALSVSMSKADLDVSVLIERQLDGLYRIGNRVSGEWYRTDPEEHTSWSSKQNAQFSGRFKPMTKLLKWARREKPTQHRHPKSFALEGLLADNLDGTETHYGALFLAYCDTFLATYQNHRALTACLRLADPAVPGGDLLSGVSGAEFCSYYDKIQKHRDDAALALAQEDQNKATTYWQRIFGPRFPAPQRKTASALRQETVMSPLAFKDAQAAPSKHPAKFA